MHLTDRLSPVHNRYKLPTQRLAIPQIVLLLLVLVFLLAVLVAFW